MIGTMTSAVANPKNTVASMSFRNLLTMESHVEPNKKCDGKTEKIEEGTDKREKFHSPPK